MNEENDFDVYQAKPDCPDCLTGTVPSPVDMDLLCDRHRKNREVRAATQKQIELSLKKFDELVSEL